MTSRLFVFWCTILNFIMSEYEIIFLTMILLASRYVSRRIFMFVYLPKAGWGLSWTSSAGVLLASFSSFGCFRSIITTLLADDFIVYVIGLLLDANTLLKKNYIFTATNIRQFLLGFIYIIENDMPLSYEYGIVCHLTFSLVNELLYKGTKVSNITVTPYE